MRARHLNRSLTLAGALALLVSSQTLLAKDYSPQWHTWKWPLYVRVDNGDGSVSRGQPRPAIWTQTAQLQVYGTTPTDNVNNYLHPGVDIRGAFGDPTALPTDATIVGAFNYGSDCTYGDVTSGHCRIWFESADQNFFYYFGHLDLSAQMTTYNRPISNDMRSKIQSVYNQTGLPGNTNNLPASTVTAKQLDLVAPLYPFGADPTVTPNPKEWEHLHLGIFDRNHNYDLYDATLLLEQNPSGNGGQQPTLPRALVDDTPPTVHQLALVQAGTSGTTDVRTSGACGQEIATSTSLANVSIKALVDDVFFPDISGIDYAAFPNKGVDTQLNGIRALRTSIVQVATGKVILQPLLWDDWSPWSENTCTDSNALTGGCLPPPPFVPTDGAFFQYLAFGKGTTDIGEDALFSLFDVAASSDNYASANSRQYWHVATNSAVETAAFANVNSAYQWNVGAMDPGLYQVSVEAQDFAGNRNSLSQFVPVHSAGSALNPSTANGLAHVYVKDNNDDLGALPSSLGGKPFWASPDIFVVPQNTTVDPNGTSTETLVTAGSTYWVYVRVRNDSKCAPVNNVKVKVGWANPDALSNSWHPITNGYEVGANPVTNLQNGIALWGPYPWPVPAGFTGDGHNCLLADVQADGEPPPSNETDAPDSNQVAQRNIQFSNCAYPISNATTTNGTVALTISLDNPNVKPTIGGTTDVELVFTDPDQSWYNTWNNPKTGQGVTYSVSPTPTGFTTLKLGTANLTTLAAVSLPAGTTRAVSMAMMLPQGVSAMLSLGVTFTSADGSFMLDDGGSCSNFVPPEPPPVK